MGLMARFLISILAEACKPWLEWIVLIKLPVRWQLGHLDSYLILNMRNKNVSCFHIKEKPFKHYVYMKINLYYLILVHSWVKYLRATNRNVLVIFSFSFSWWQCFWWSQFSGLFIEIFFYNYSFIIWALLVRPYFKTEFRSANISP